MRVTLSRPSTGLAFFPGLAKARSVDTGTLDPADAAALTKLVEAVLARPPGPDPSPGRQADAMAYEVVIETPDAPAVFRTGRPTPELKALADFVDAKSSS